ncbi:UBN2_3 domain-containing protein [Cucumis melo var. makuwa]|uniref:UBN2_3 domain-containing protein n=1 Tax=Cucumis melo var. makuwa TaxID=1194695 RepID=A0A5A7SPD2_CUCMM|nr:UBN2_3 domain-containing protein [Cucumis melo var. makuwa]TYK06800.1 UBN2_3 domain-containing protein [Cucumis melo var. makuwa]
MAIGETNSNSSMFLPINICKLIFVHLDSTNYVLSKFLISPTLKAHHLFCPVDGSYTALKKVICDEQQPPKKNPEFEKWQKKYQGLISLINVFLSETAISHVVGCHSALKFCKHLRNTSLHPHG